MDKKNKQDKKKTNQEAEQDQTEHEGIFIGVS